MAITKADTSLPLFHLTPEIKGCHCHIIIGQPIRWAPPSNDLLVPEEFSGSFDGRREPRRSPGISSKMIITTWIVYILARKGAGFPFPPKISSVSRAGGSYLELFLIICSFLSPPLHFQEIFIYIKMYNFG